MFPINSSLGLCPSTFLSANYFIITKWDACIFANDQTLTKFGKKLKTIILIFSKQVDNLYWNGYLEFSESWFRQFGVFEKVVPSSYNFYISNSKLNVQIQFITRNKLQHLGAGILSSEKFAETFTLPYYINFCPEHKKCIPPPSALPLFQVSTRSWWTHTDENWNFLNMVMFRITLKKGLKTNILAYIGHFPVDTGRRLNVH